MTRPAVSIGVTSDGVTILEPVTTTERRKHIPLKVKLETLIRQARCPVCNQRLGKLADVAFDHRPALVAREWDEAAGDFVPRQHDPEFLQATHRDCNQFLANGTIPAGKEVQRLARSDVGEAAHSRRVQKREEEFRRRLLAKDAGEPEEKSRWQKKQWPKKQKRPWPKRQLVALGPG